MFPVQPVGVELVFANRRLRTGACEPACGDGSSPNVATMAVSDFTDEVQVKVYRSHVKIPVLFLVPLAVLATLYCVVYFYANSNWFLDELPGLLQRVFPGTFKVRELVVEPSLTEVHVYGAQIRRTAEAKPAVSAPEVHAKVDPLFLLVGRLVFEKGRAEGAHVRLAFDEEGEMNLLQALGIDPPDEPPEEGKRPLPIIFRDLAAVDCSFEFVQPEFDFRIPDVNVEHVSISIGDELEMRAPQVEVPAVDFRFRSEMFGFGDDRGDWRFGVEDVAVDRWHWRDDGFRVDHVSFYAEGMRAEAEGRMSFPNTKPDEPEMEYRGRGRIRVPYWSPLAQYFIQDAVHFEVPALEAAVDGSLEVVDGRVRAEADLLNAAGLIFTDVEGEATLRNQYIMLDRAEADFYGGRVEADWAFFDMFDVSYGGAGSVEGVNPAALLRSYDVDLPLLDGGMSGRFEATGAVPMARTFDVDDAYPTLTDASRDLADVELTNNWTFRPSSRSTLPASSVTVERGARVAVDYERVEIPNARIRAPDAKLDVRHFEMDYNRMIFTAPTARRAVDLKAEVGDVGPWLENWGVSGFSGSLDAEMWANGPLGAPEGGLKARLGSADVRSGGVDVEGASGLLDARVSDGEFTLEAFEFRSDLGDATAEGRARFAEVDTSGSETRWRYKRRKPVDFTYAVDRLDLAALDRWAGGVAGAKGRLDVSGSVTGTVDVPEAAFEASVAEGEVTWLRFRQLELRGTVSPRRLELGEMSATVAESGRVSAAGTYGFGDGSYRFQTGIQGVKLGEVKYLDAVAGASRPRGRLEVDLEGEGSITDPEVSGDIELRELRVGDRELGDLALVANTVDELLYITGAALPIGTLTLEIPLVGEDAYHAKFGVEHLDFARVFPEIRSLSLVDRLEGTGVVEFDAASDFSDYVVTVDMSTVRLETPEASIRTDGPLRASLDSNNRLQVEEARIGSRGHFIDIRGGVLLDSLVTSVRLSGELDLALVDVVSKHVFPEAFPEALVESKGVVDVDVEVSGPPSRPIPSGSLTVRSATFSFRDLSTPLRLTRGTIAFDSDAVRVPSDAPLAGEVLGGLYNLSGRVGIEDNTLKDARFDLWSHNIVYRVPETANVTFDTDIDFEARDIARPSTWTVGGQIDLLSARYFRNISLFEEQVTGRVLGTITRQTERFEAGALEKYPWLSEIEFDMRIRAREGVVIDNKIDRFRVELEMRLDLQLQRTLGDPRVSGEVEVAAGTVEFQGERFEVRTGTIEYTGDPNNPRVEITAGADIRNRCIETDTIEEVRPSSRFAGDFDDARSEIYHVILSVEGRLDTLNVEFESNPYADQRDILSLMLTGCTVDELTASGATQPGLEIALGPLLGQIEREVRDVVELSEFTIMPGVERTQVRIADRVTRRLEWRFQLDTGLSERSGGQRYQLEYKLSDRWSAEVSERSFGEQENFLLDAKLKYRIPFD